MQKHFFHAMSNVPTQYQFSVHKFEINKKFTKNMIFILQNILKVLGKGRSKKNVFLGYLFQMWVGGVADSQTRSKPLKITPKIAFFDPNFTFCFPKSYKNPGVGGWLNRFGKGFPKKVFFIPSLRRKSANRNLQPS